MGIEESKSAYTITKSIYSAKAPYSPCIMGSFMTLPGQSHNLNADYANHKSLILIDRPEAELKSKREGTGKSIRQVLELM